MASKRSPASIAQRRQYSRRRYAANIEAERAAARPKARAYYAAHADEYKDRVDRRRRALVGAISRRVVWDRDRGICGICSLPADPGNWHLDHVFPVIDGGSHTYDNVRVTHPGCNLTKGRKHAE